MFVAATVRERVPGWWQILAGSAYRWRWTVLGTASLALLVRILVIAHSHGGSDLRNYTYFSDLALHGHDPFLAPAHGLFPPRAGDNPPLESAIFSLLLRIHDSAAILRAAFALADVGVIMVVGLLFRQPKPWRGAFIAFYAVNPFVLVSWTAYSEDKTILFLAIVIVFLGLDQGRVLTSWMAATFLTVFKFLGAFLMPVLFIDTLRRRRAQALWFVLGFGMAFAASHILWFPDGFKDFARRNQRLSIDSPIHASPVLLLHRIGVYATFEPKVLTVLAVALVFGLFVARLLEVKEAVAWSLFSGYIFLPDDSFNRLLLIALPFLLLCHPTARQWVILWGVTSLAAVAAVIETQGVPHALSPVASLMRAVFSQPPTIRSMLWMNAPLVAVLVTYLLQHRRQGSEGTPLKIGVADR